jgi:hypothetical protein
MVLVGSNKVGNLSIRKGNSPRRITESMGNLFLNVTSIPSNGGANCCSRCSNEHPEFKLHITPFYVWLKFNSVF